MPDNINVGGYTYSSKQLSDASQVQALEPVAVTGVPGAWTKVPLAGTAGTAAAAVLSVQGIAGMTPLAVADNPTLPDLAARLDETNRLLRMLVCGLYALNGDTPPAELDSDFT